MAIKELIAKEFRSYERHIDYLRNRLQMWEIFDFGHEANIKELREAMSRLLKETDEEKTWLAVKILPACA